MQLRNCAGMWSLGLFSFAVSVQATDKTNYSLANPTPEAELRELSTDRPDITESPFTIDAGHVQLEADFARYTYNHLDGTRERTWEIAPTNLRLGVRNNLEVGIFISPFTRFTTKDPNGATEKHSGFGDVTLRGKWNINGNDPAPGEKSPAFGVIVDLTLPTSAHDLGADKMEGGVALPMAFELPGGWDGGAMTRVDAMHDRTDGWQTVWTNTLTLGRSLTKSTSAYVEVVSEVGSGAAVTLASVGAAWQMNGSTQFDAGAVFGLSRHADDVQLFVGVSRRF